MSTHDWIKKGRPAGYQPKARWRPSPIGLAFLFVFLAFSFLVFVTFLRS